MNALIFFHGVFFNRFVAVRGSCRGVRSLARPQIYIYIYIYISLSTLFFWLSQISTTYNFAILWDKVMKFCSYVNGVAILWITTFHPLATLIRYFSRAPKSAIFGNFTHLYGSMCWQSIVCCAVYRTYDFDLFWYWFVLLFLLL